MAHGGSGLGIVGGSGFCSGSPGFRILLGPSGPLLSPSVSRATATGNRGPPVVFSRFHSLSLSRFFPLSLRVSPILSLLFSLSQKRREERKKGDREKKGNRVSLLFRFSLLPSLFSLKLISNLSSLTTSPFSHDRPRSET
jgi:hypothetical protein